MLPLFLPLPLVYLCLCFASLALATDSRADAVLLQFKPPNQSGVAGYKVYFAPQTTGPLTATPVDIGARAPDASGVASYSLAGLDPSRAYSFEVTAYDSTGVQSAHSNRLNLDARTEVLGDVLWTSDFAKYAPGVHVPGFADSRGDTRTTTGTDLFEVAYVANDPAFGTSAPAGSVSTRYLGSAAPNWGSYEIAGRLWTGTTTAAAAVALRATDDPDRFFGFGQTGSGMWMAWGAGEPALTCRGSSSTGVTQPAMTWYSFRVRVTKASGLTRLRGMVWRQGAAAPATWQTDCWTTLSAAADSGAFGLRRNGSGSAFFDNLSITEVTGKIEAIPPAN
jgi:fibronectin type III domain protein